MRDFETMDVRSSSTLPRPCKPWVHGGSVVLIAAALTIGCGADTQNETDGGSITSDGAGSSTGTDDGELDPGVSLPSIRLALTPTEYNNTVADLLGFPRDGQRWPAVTELAQRLGARKLEANGVFLGTGSPEFPVWPWEFPAQAGVDDFEGIFQGQQPSAYLTEELHWAAVHFASFALVAPRILVCEDWDTLGSAEQIDCGFRTLERFMQRAYRRELSAAQRQHLTEFWQANLAAFPIDESLALGIAGILESPGFVFRGEPAELDDWQLAERLAYFLWDSLPDQELFAAAARGDLATAQGVENQARRLLADDRARPAVIHFHHQLLGTDRVLGVNPARRAYGQVFGIQADPKTDTTGDEIWPGIIVPLRYSMLFETELFVEGIIFNGDASFTSLMTDNHGYMSSRSQVIYGAGARRLDGRVVTRSYAAVAASLGTQRSLTLFPAEFPAHERAGLLTLPAVLALGAYAVQPGPILRGKRVLERLACVEFGTPPAGAEASLPPDTLDASATNRQRTEQATSAAVCSGCHQQINPPGLAFEHYDALGMWRAQDNGQPVHAGGVLSLPAGEMLSFSDGVDLARQLAASQEVRDCYALRWTRYALGDQIESGTPGVSELQQQFRINDSILELLVAIARSSLFRSHRSGDPQ